MGAERRIRELERGASEKVRAATVEAADPVRSILRTRTILWIILSGITVNSSAYAGNGFLGPVVVGGLSDALAKSAMTASGSLEMTDTFRAAGLHDAMFLIPVTLFLTAVFVFLASRSFSEDARRMRERLASNPLDQAPADHA